MLGIADRHPLDALDRGVELDEPVEGCHQLVGGPGGGLAGEGLGPEWVEPHRADERARRLAGLQSVGDLDQLADPPVENGEENRLGRRFDEAVVQLERAWDEPAADRVDEGPDRARDGLWNESPDIVRGDRA